MSRNVSIVIIAALLLLSCSKKQETIGEDSVLVKPVETKVDTVHPKPDSLTGLFVDSFGQRISQHPAVLDRFTPKQVMAIYEAYWPLRSESTTEEARKAFLTQHAITNDELKAILAKGDALGWAEDLKSRNKKTTH